MRETTKDLLHEIDTNDLEKIVTSVILMGGKYYYIEENLVELGLKPMKGEIIIKSREEYRDGDIVARIVEDKGLKKIICNDGDWNIIIGETIASGATMETFLNYIAECSRYINKLIIIGFHTFRGIKRTLKNINKLGINAEIYSLGGLLGLGKNLTDMTLGDAPNEIPEPVTSKVFSRLGQTIGKRLCMVGDFTNSVAHPEKYIAERVIQFWEIYRETQEQKALYYIREGISRLMTMGLSIENIDNLVDMEYKKRISLIGEKPPKHKITVEELLKSII